MDKPLPWTVTPEDEPTLSIAVSFPATMYDEIDAAAKRMGMRRATFVRLAVSSFLEDDVDNT